MARAQHYLTNKEILKEIHNSKISYCWLLDKKYNMYDIILNDISEINDTVLVKMNDDGTKEYDTNINIARKNRAKRLQRLAHEAEVKQWERGLTGKKTKPKAAEFAVELDSILDEDLVVRVMTFEHIPLEQRKTNPKTVADNHSRCNFPPFKQYSLIDEEWTEVTRSHWKGDLTDGKFSVTHGRTNERLAFMYMKLCERYSQRSNWRGYTYVDEMRGQAILQLTQIGLQFNEAKSDNPFAYYTAAITNSFTRVLNLEKRSQNIRDDLLEEQGLDPSFTRSFNAEWEGVKEREGLDDFYGTKKEEE